MKSIVRTRKVGGSLTVTLPKEIVKEQSIQPGELIEIEVERPRKDYFGVFKGMKPFTKEDELDTHE